MKRNIVSSLAVAALGLFLLVPAASADVEAPDVKWKDPLPSGSVHPRTGGVDWNPGFNTWWTPDGHMPLLWFDNSQSGNLKIRRFEVTVPYRCDDGSLGKKVLSFNRDIKNRDESDVRVVDDDGVLTLVFSWKGKNDNQWLSAKGRAKLKAYDSNQFEYDAFGRAAWGNGECRSLGGADTPMGWVGKRSPIS